MKAEDTLETNCSIQVDVSCWDRTGVPTPSHTFQSNITLSCQHICVLYYHYYFILSAHLCSLLSLSLYLVSTFIFILTIITLSCHQICVHSYHYHFILSLVSPFILIIIASLHLHQGCWPRPSLPPLMWSLKKFRRGRGTNFLHLFYILVWGSIYS